jgi:hypothetical protein
MLASDRSPEHPATGCSPDAPRYHPWPHGDGTVTVPPCRTKRAAKTSASTRTAPAATHCHTRMCRVNSWPAQEPRAPADTAIVPSHGATPPMTLRSSTLGQLQWQNMHDAASPSVLRRASCRQLHTTVSGHAWSGACRTCCSTWTATECSMPRGIPVRLPATVTGITVLQSALSAGVPLRTSLHVANIWRASYTRSTAMVIRAHSAPTPMCSSTPGWATSVAPTT